MNDNTVDNMQNADKEARKLKLKRVLRMVPIFLVLAAIMTYCIVIIFTEDKKPSKPAKNGVTGENKTIENAYLTYNIRGVGNGGSFDETMAIGAPTEFYVMSEKEWESHYTMLTKNDMKEPLLEITISNLPGVLIRIDPRLKDKDNALTVSENGNVLFAAAIPVSWKEGDDKDSVWFHDVTGDGFPDVLVNNTHSGTKNRFGLYDIKNGKSYQMETEDDLYELKVEFDNVAVWLKEFSNKESIAGNWPYKGAVKGSFAVRDNQLKVVVDEKPIDDVPVTDPPLEIYRWFDRDDGDEQVKRVIRLAENPDTVFVVERTYAYYQLPSGELNFWSDSEVTAAYFFDLDGDGKRDLFFAKEGNGPDYRNLCRWDGAFRPEEIIGWVYGRYYIVGTELFLKFRRTTDKDRIVVMQPIFFNGKIELLRDVPYGESFPWDGESIIRLAAYPDTYYDLKERIIYREDADGLVYEEDNFLKRREFGRAYLTDLNGDGIQEFCAMEIISYNVGVDSTVLGNIIADMRENAVIEKLPGSYKFGWYDEALWVVPEDYKDLDGAGRDARIGRPFLVNGTLTYSK